MKMAHILLILCLVAGVGLAAETRPLPQLAKAEAWTATQPTLLPVSQQGVCLCILSQFHRPPAVSSLSVDFIFCQRRLHL